MFARIFYEMDGRVILNLEARNSVEYGRMVEHASAWVEACIGEPRGVRTVPLASRAVSKIVSIDGAEVSL